MFLHYVLAVVLVAQGCLASLNERITDGEEAPAHQFPYQVSIVWGAPPFIKFRHVCGGAILNENWVITAGHCVTELPPIGSMLVQAGKHIINKREDGQQVSGVGLKVVHWKYLGGVGQHDIALLKLTTRLHFNDDIGSVKLPPAGRIHKGNVVLSGWGSVSKKLLPELPKILHSATVPVVDNKKCLEALHELPGDSELFDTQMCTGPLGGTVSACIGDSGGPLVKYDEDAVPELAGIISWGAYPCGSGVPTVYTRVSSYIDWINHKLEG